MVEGCMIEGDWEYNFAFTLYLYVCCEISLQKTITLLLSCLLHRSKYQSAFVGIDNPYHKRSNDFL
jgi:hypothetical protein